LRKQQQKRLARNCEDGAVPKRKADTAVARNILVALPRTFTMLSAYFITKDTAIPVVVRRKNAATC